MPTRVTRLNGADLAEHAFLAIISTHHKATGALCALQEAEG